MWAASYLCRMALDLRTQRAIVHDTIDHAEATGAMTRGQADALRDQVTGATIGSIIAASSCVVSGEQLSKVNAPPMQGGAVADRMNEAVEGFGRKTTVRSRVNLPQIQAHLQANITQLIKDGAALFYGQAFSGAEVNKRADGFLAPKPVEAAFLSRREGIEARVMVYQANIAEKPVYVLFANDTKGQPHWNVTVFSAKGQVLVDATAKPDGNGGVTFSWPEAKAKA